MPWRNGYVVEVQLHSFFTQSLDGEWLLQAPAALSPETNPGTCWTGDWVGHSADMDVLMKIKMSFPDDATTW